VSDGARQLIDAIPLFSGIERAGLEGILRIFQPVGFAAATPLVRQGQSADGAYIIESGSADVITALPGGGEATVATLGPGSVLGEMALLESGTRSATVIAKAPVKGYFVERDSFRMLLAQRERAAFTIQNRITLTLCQRVREMNDRIVASSASQNAVLLLSGQMAGPESLRRGQCSFDFRSFLPLLPIFRRFSARELAEFTGKTELLELDRGRILFHQGDPGEAAYVVVRGALEIGCAANGQRHRIGILGPGRLCGVMALAEGHPHSMGAAARERTVLLELGKAGFDALFTGRDAVAAKFQDAINRELLQDLARTNNHLTRLVSQARIRGGRQERKKAEELQRALGAQDVRSKDEG